MARRKQTALAKAMSHNLVADKVVPEATDYDTGAGEDPALSRPATPHVIDFAAAARQPDPVRPHKIIDGREVDAEGKLMTSKRIRARARRAMRQGKKIPQEVAKEIWKPIEEWDMEELARGRPRSADGSFRGRKPSYVSRELHEQAMDTFKQMVRSELNGNTVDALLVLNQVLNNDEVDNKGRPVVGWATKVDAAKWMVEHVVGKAVQPTTSDISAKLQLILGAAMVNPSEVDMPAELEGYRPAHIGFRQEAVDEDTEDEDVEEAEIVWE
jgi:hypothetical protein